MTTLTWSRLRISLLPNRRHAGANVPREYLEQGIALRGDAQAHHVKFVLEIEDAVIMPDDSPGMTDRA
jgi:hypothetical protein